MKRPLFFVSFCLVLFATTMALLPESVFETTASDRADVDDKLKTKSVPLYLINQTELPMMEVWIGYSETPVTPPQNYFISSPILVGPTPVFIGNVDLPKTGGKEDSEANPGGEKKNENSWMLYWRDENDSLNGLEQRFQASAKVENGHVELYVIGVASPEKQLVRVNQLGLTINSGKWKVLLPISSEEKENDDKVKVDEAVDR